MSYRHTIQAGLETLREIEQMLSDFREKENIPAVELDLVLQKTRNFYDIMLMLKQHQMELMHSLSGGHGPSSSGTPSGASSGAPSVASSGASSGIFTGIKETAVAEDTAGATTRAGSEASSQASAGAASGAKGGSVAETATDKDQPATGEAAGAMKGTSTGARIDEEQPETAAGVANEAAAMTIVDEASPAAANEVGSTTKAKAGADSDGKPPSQAQAKEAAILSDRFSGRSSLYDSIHEAVSQRDGGPIGQVKPVSTIRSAIGINERFAYIRELFNNDAAAFDTTIGLLDDAANFNEAYNYMIQRFDWDMDSPTVQQLLDIIRRKYITGRHE